MQGSLVQTRIRQAIFAVDPDEQAQGHASHILLIQAAGRVVWIIGWEQSDDRYRTTPLRALVAHGKLGYHHDGRFPTLADVVEHYDSFLGLGLTTDQKADLVTFLRTL